MRLLRRKVALGSPAVRRGAWLGLVVAACLAAGCSPLLLLNGTDGDRPLRAQRDIAYGPLHRQRLDIYALESAASNRPVIVFFYGGAWQRGERWKYRFVGEALAADGAVAVVPDYRVYPEARFPDFVRDGARAVAWVRENIGRFGGDPSRIYLMGHSAGAHIAALLALDARYLQGEGLSPRDLRGFIGLAGPYDFLPLRSERLKDVFEDTGDPGRLAATQPINFASPQAPPSLLLTGASDGVVRPSNTQRLAERLHAAGAVVTEKVYPDLGHPGIILALSTALRHLAPVREDIAHFIAAEK